MGAAASHPTIIAQGLYLELEPGEKDSYCLRYKDYYNFSAAEYFLFEDRDFSDVVVIYRLFLQTCYPKNVKPEYVAKCIRHIANGGDYPRVKQNWINIVPEI